MWRRLQLIRYVRYNAMKIESQKVVWIYHHATDPSIISPLHWQSWLTVSFMAKISLRDKRMPTTCHKWNEVTEWGCRAFECTGYTASPAPSCAHFLVTRPSSPISASAKNALFLEMHSWGGYSKSLDEMMTIFMIILNASNWIALPWETKKTSRQ